MAVSVILLTTRNNLCWVRFTEKIFTPATFVKSLLWSPKIFDFLKDLKKISEEKLSDFEKSEARKYSQGGSFAGRVDTPNKRSDGSLLLRSQRPGMSLALWKERPPRRHGSKVPAAVLRYADDSTTLSTSQPPGLRAPLRRKINRKVLDTHRLYDFAPTPCFIVIRLGMEGKILRKSKTGERV